MTLTITASPGEVRIEIEGDSESGEWDALAKTVRSRDEVDELIARLVSARVTAWPAQAWEDEDEC